MRGGRHQASRCCSGTKQAQQLAALLALSERCSTSVELRRSTPAGRVAGGFLDGYASTACCVAPFAAHTSRVCIDAEKTPRARGACDASHQCPSQTRESTVKARARGTLHEGPPRGVAAVSLATRIGI